MPTTEYGTPSPRLPPANEVWPRFSPAECAIHHHDVWALGSWLSQGMGAGREEISRLEIGIFQHVARLSRRSGRTLILGSTMALTGHAESFF